MVVNTEMRGAVIFRHQHHQGLLLGSICPPSSMSLIQVCSVWRPAAQTTWPTPNRSSPISINIVSDRSSMSCHGFTRSRKNMSVFNQDSLEHSPPLLPQTTTMSSRCSGRARPVSGTIITDRATKTANTGTKVPTHENEGNTTTSEYRLTSIN